MAARRSRLELIFDILLAIQNKGGRIKPTHLMYKSNLSHKLLNNYLQELIEKGANVNAQDKKGYTALHWAAYWNDEKMTKMLLEAGAKTNLKSDLGQTPVESARIFKHRDSLKHLEQYVPKNIG